MRRALRRQVLGQRLPLATRREHVEDCVENLANIHLAPTAAALGWRDHRLNQRPFGIRQVTRISQTTPLSSAAMFRFPHLGTPQSKIRVPHNESQMIHPTQQLSGSALRSWRRRASIIRRYFKETKSQSWTATGDAGVWFCFTRGSGATFASRFRKAMRRNMVRLLARPTSVQRLCVTPEHWAIAPAHHVRRCLKTRRNCPGIAFRVNRQVRAIAKSLRAML